MNGIPLGHLALTFDRIQRPNRLNHAPRYRKTGGRGLTLRVSKPCHGSRSNNFRKTYVEINLRVATTGAANNTPSKPKRLANTMAATMTAAGWIFRLSPIILGTTKLSDRKSTRLNSSHQKISYAVL